MRMKLFTLCSLFSALMVANASAQNRFYLSQVANGRFDGGSFRTTFIMFNNSGSSGIVILNLTDDNGNPFSVNIAGLGSGSTFNFNLESGATRILQTDGSGNLVAGAAAVTATANIGMSAIFTIYDSNGNFITESGVGSSALLKEFVIPVDVTGSFNTGLALYNPNSATASITLILYDSSGKESGRTAINLNGNAHLARFVAGASQFFPTITEFRGTLVVQSSASIAAVTLRQNGSPLSYTSLPVVSRSSTQTSLSLAQVANGSYSAGSFRTTFLIFNISAAAAKVRLDLTKDNGSTFDVTIPGQGGMRSGFDFSLAAGASLFLQTDGTGTLATGAARITSDVPIGASAIFSVFNAQGQFQTEAGVGDSPVLDELTLPVDTTGAFNTGIAFFNPTTSNSALTIRLLDSSGIVIGSSVTLPLPALNHTAKFVTELFGSATNFRGTLAISAAGGVAAVTLRQNDPPLRYTTLPVASGIAGGSTKALVLLSQTRTGVPATSNITLNQSLPPGFRISGKITGAGTPLVVFARSQAGDTFAGRLDIISGRYLIVVPAGTYSLKLCYTPAVTKTLTVPFLTYTDPVPVQVSADATRNIGMPVPTLYKVSGTIGGLGNLPASTTSPLVILTSLDNSYQGQFKIDDNSYFEGLLPPSSYQASIRAQTMQISTGQIQVSSLLNIGSVIVSNGEADANVAIPRTAKLSGKVQASGFATIPTGTMVVAVDTSSPLTVELTCATSPGTSSSTVGSGGQYQTTLLAYRSYNVEVLLSLLQGSKILGTVLYPVSNNTLNPNEDTLQDFNLPALPAQVIISGRVTDSAGQGVASITVSAFSQTLSGGGNLGYTGDTTTDSNGNYSLTILSGTNYRVTFTPTPPSP